MTRNEVIRALEKTKQYFKTHPWGVRDYYDEVTGGACVVGGCAKANSLDIHQIEHGRIGYFLEMSAASHNITTYNDSLQSKKEAVAWIDKAISLAEETSNHELQ